MRPEPFSRIALALLLAIGFAQVFQAQAPSDARGHVGLALMLRKLATVGTVMHAMAHPDDENNGLVAMQSHGQGFRVVYATLTRGNGGQNEIGPELSEALGVLRTEELLAAHRHDGGEQFFGLAVDFGYSFSIDETYEKWGREATIGDLVRLMRTTRPDIVLTMRPDGAGGGQHHQASARLALEASDAAGDPARFPDQSKDGLRPWRPRKIYRVGFYGFFPGEQEPPPGAQLVPVDSNVYDPLLGRTYSEIGAEGRAMHKCQGMAQVLPLPGAFSIKYQLAGTSLAGGVERDEQALTDGLDLTLGGLASFAGPEPPAALTRGLGEIAARVSGADRALRELGPGAAVADLARGLVATRSLLAFTASGDGGLSSEAAYEIAFRLRHTERKFEQALVLAQGLRLEALAADGVVVPGQPVKLTLVLANRGSQPVRLSGVGDLAGFVERQLPCQAPAAAAPSQIVRCEGTVTIPADARTSEPYWHRDREAGRYTIDADAPFGLPFRPTPFTVDFALEFDGAAVRVTLPVQHRYEGNVFSGEKRMELQVVPQVTLRTAPAIAILPHLDGRRVPARAGQPARAAVPADSSRPISATVTNNTPGPLEIDVRLEAPDGWIVAPASRHVTFARADEADTVTFVVSAPPDVATGTWPIAAVAQADGKRFDRGYQAIEYPHVQRRHTFEPATTTIQVIDAAMPEALVVGYVMGVGDQVPPALEQLGARVVMLDEAALASGDLSRFDAIVTGVRAYERRRDLRAYNHRLLQYAEGGGTVVVQYNKYEFNQAQYGPYPAKVGSDRVTDERAPVSVLVPDHPIFTSPNRIDARTWEGWVQERGLYFLGTRDARYVDLVELADPFENNPGPKRGALVEARVGKGRWIYVGLGLWRQLPAGTEGAYQLLANIVSLGRTERAASR
jgi:LmbE family N-acetylglucosaminyl deacetylase